VSAIVTEANIPDRPCDECREPADRHYPTGPIDDHEWVCDTCQHTWRGHTRPCVPCVVCEENEDCHEGDRMGHDYDPITWQVTS
jgi:hypothetical protein